MVVGRWRLAAVLKYCLKHTDKRRIFTDCRGGHRTWALQPGTMPSLALTRLDHIMSGQAGLYRNLMDAENLFDILITVRR